MVLRLGVRCVSCFCACFIDRLILGLSMSLMLESLSLLSGPRSIIFSVLCLSINFNYLYNLMVDTISQILSMVSSRLVILGFYLCYSAFCILYEC
jgi:hypothetical protein